MKSPTPEEKPGERIKLNIVSPEKPKPEKKIQTQLDFSSVQSESNFSPPSPKPNKVEVGPAQVDLKQWLGDSLKSIVRPNPRRTYGK